MCVAKWCRVKVLMMTVLIGIAGSGSLFAQVEMKRSPKEVERTFFFDAMSYASDQANKSRVDVYVQVPYEEIRFYRDGDYFVGRYEITLTVLTSSLQMVLERSWMVDVRVDNFAQTTSNKLYSLTQRAVEIEPGQYQLNVQVRDFESQKTSQVRRGLLVSDFRKDPLSLSDIMLVNRLTTDGEKKNIVPNISGNVGHLSDGFFIFLEVYGRTDLDSVDLTWRIMNLKSALLFKRLQTEVVRGKKAQAFLKIDSVTLPMGSYVLTVDAMERSSPEGSPALNANTSRTFHVRSADLPPAIVDINKAIDQLIYIARDSELQYVREGTDDEERRKRFLEFWAKRDPDPQSPRNELMEEYYARVEYANYNFTHHLEGWKTDMGMVYIRFGTPENIERHPFDQGTKPYEVWYYYQLNRQFVFVDETGFGDYRLRYPTTDLFGRVR